MFAITLEKVFAELLSGSDFAPVDRQAVAKRFEALRSSGRLPMGRENRDARLSARQIGDSVLGLIPINPGWAGHASTVLTNLRPVGGFENAFANASSLGNLIEILLTKPELRRSVQYLSISTSGRQSNVSGLASLVWVDGCERRVQGFVSAMAVSLLSPGASDQFNPDSTGSPVRRDFRLSRLFFDKLADQIEWSLSVETAPGDGSEYDADDTRKARLERLGVRRNARYLNIGIETRAFWPKTEMVIKFEGHNFVVMPQTEEHSASIHVDLYNERLTSQEAMTIINRLLSVMAWEDDASIVCRDGWSGNPVPVAVSHRDLARMITPIWLRAQAAPSSESVRRALAYYREGLNADGAELHSYALLSFLKAIEIRFPEDTPKLKRWLSSNYALVASDDATDLRLARFEQARGAELPEVYIWKACRVAVAHASENYPSDPDEFEEAGRLATAAYVLSRLARRMINELIQEAKAASNGVDSATAADVASPLR